MARTAKKTASRKPVKRKTSKSSKSALRKAADEVAAKLAKAGFEAVFAGGCVRDMLTGREPRDFDIATSATPQSVQELFPKTFAVGAQFGVVVVLHAGHQFEVATYRVDSDYSDGRHPDAVEFGDARADVMRRDFTINGMLYDPKKDKVVDYVDGQKDLKKKVVRCIGEPEHRLAEDKLRMLRAVRFSSRLGFEIEPATREAILRLAPQITVVSQERIKTELELILTSAAAVRGIIEMRDLGLLRPVLPEAEAIAQVRLATESLLDHALAVLGRLKEPSFELALAALLHCSGGADEKEQVHESARLVSVAARRLKCSNSERSSAAWLVLNQYALQDAKERRLSYMKRLFVHRDFDVLLALVKAKAETGCADMGDFDFAAGLKSKLSSEEIQPEPLLSGTDLIEMGLKPSELFSVIIDGVYDAQLNGEIADRQEAIELALKITRES